jgi:glycosyltransferase involved in cell wall biosynthesis
VRIGLVVYGSLDMVSGGYIYDRKLVEHLRRQGEQVELISLPWRNYGRHLADNLSPTLYRRLSDGSLDVLLQDELNHASLFWVNRRLRAQVGYPIVAIVHHLRCSEVRPAWQNRLYRWVERRYLSTVDGFIFNSQTTKAAVESVLGMDRRFGRAQDRPAVVAYPGGNRLCLDLPPAQVASRARSPGPLRILFIGNLIPRKGLHVLLDGLSRLRWDSWRLDVVGSLAVDLAYVRAIRRQIKETGVTDQVSLSGPLPDAELVNCMARSHVLCVPSSYEGFGIVYLEGMAAGLPAIASSAGAAHEIVTHGLDGFLMPAGNTSALADHIRTLNADRERLVRMSLAAQQRYTAHPTWAESGERARQFLMGVSS